MIRVHSRVPGRRAPRKFLTRLLDGALRRRFGRARPGRVSVDLLLLDDPAIRLLNRRHTGENRPTDVLAFPDGEIDPGDGRRHLGDVAVSLETASREAGLRRVPVRHEVALYAIHGLLHLLGLEDKTAKGRAAMREAERSELARHGILPHWEPE
ncbi:MAG: rRNA maturation RNase YbeY [Planctomycetota bacterium]